MRLGILTSHPIQYYSPWFRALANQVDLEVFYAHRPDAAQQGAGFGRSFDWDVDLVSGYKHHFLNNISPQPGLNHFTGCDTPEIAGIIAGTTDDGRRMTGPEVGSRRAEGGGKWLVVSGQSSVVPRRFDAFIVVGWYLKTFWQAIRACRRAGVPILVRGDSQLRTPRPLLKRLAMEVRQRWLLRQFDGFLYVGERNREYLAHYGVPPEKMFFAPHFVDNEWFRGKAEIERKRKAEIRKRWGIPEEAFCVLFCGKFISKKRPMDLVEAARILTAENAKSAKENSKQPVHLLFAGSGEIGAQLRANCNVIFDAERPVEKQKVESRKQKSSISNLPSSMSARPRATFAGFLNQSELPPAYAAADVLVLPSDGGETWGLVVNEAMACGLPAIVSDAAGCAPDLIDEGRTGFTFALGDTAQLAQRLKQLDELRQRNQDFAPALADKMKAYSIEAAVAGTLTGLKSIQSRQKSL